tara:strand:- start:567 stop:767 length:201 start_codon:yes stop_codon:yes gene_type:complete
MRIRLMPVATGTHQQSGSGGALSSALKVVLQGAVPVVDVGAGGGAGVAAPAQHSYNALLEKAAPLG